MHPLMVKRLWVPQKYGIMWGGITVVFKIQPLFPEHNISPQCTIIYSLQQYNILQHNFKQIACNWVFRCSVHEGIARCCVADRQEKQSSSPCTLSHLVIQSTSSYRQEEERLWAILFIHLFMSKNNGGDTQFRRSHGKHQKTSLLTSRI